MTEAHHSNPAAKWLFFFFCCFGTILLGIVIFFARDVNTQNDADKANSGGGHHSMVLPSQISSPYFVEQSRV